MVCVVDDDRAFRESVIDLLEASGWRTVGFGHPDDLLECHPRPKPNCFLLDVYYRDQRDCFELLEEHRRLECTVPVILMTGNPSSRLKSRASAEGIERVLEKPIDPDTLLKALDHAVGGRGSQRDPRAH